MSDIDFAKGDDISDLLDGVPSTAPKSVPQDVAFERIRALSDQPPVAPVFKVNCSKCGGSGRFRSWSGRDVGPCHTCKGKGYHERKTSPQQLAANRAATAERKVRNEAGRWGHFAEKYPQHAEWLLATIKRLNERPTASSEGYLSFLTSLKAGIAKYGNLSIAQLAAVEKGMARDAERDGQKVRQVTVAQARTVEANAQPILDAFRKARESGLKYVCLRLQRLVINEAKKFPGRLYVKTSDGIYAGKIENGIFSPSSECSDELKAKIILVVEDPAAAAKTYGLETGQCSCCGRELTNKDSIALGIGPICAERFGW